VTLLLQKTLCHSVLTLQYVYNSVLSNLLFISEVAEHRETAVHHVQSE